MADNTEDFLNRRWQLRGNFNKQVAYILHSVTMPPVELKGLEILHEDIWCTFSKIWPGCIVKPFGSTVMGLALKNSDVDCFLEIPARYAEDPDSCVYKCRDLITAGPSPFLEVSVIPSRRIPLVQFFHAKTGRPCDLSFNRPIAVEFGKLMNFMLNSDRRVRPLAILIKCWAKIQKVSGNRLLPSNALIILIIFFLQHKEIVPPVAELQQNSSPNIIDGWHTAFTEMPYAARNEESVYNLLGQFFAYYSMFDFRNTIVCPYLGYSIERSKFHKVNSVPAAFQRYKANLKASICQSIYLNSILCIQDPFDHSRNCAGPVRPQVAEEIIRHFQNSADVYTITSPYGVLTKLLTFKYSERQDCREYWKPSRRNKNTGGPPVCRRSTPRSRAYRARFSTTENPFKNL